MNATQSSVTDSTVKPVDLAGAAKVNKTPRRGSTRTEKKRTLALQRSANLTRASERYIGPAAVANLTSLRSVACSPSTIAQTTPPLRSALLNRIINVGVG